MKKLLRVFTFVFGLAFVYSLVTSSSGGRATVANSGNTGAPNETATCSSCHGGGSYGLVTLTIQVFQQGTTTPVAAYSPNTTYDMRVTVQNASGTPNGYGFQLTALTQGTNTPLAGYTNLATNVKQKTITNGTWSGRTYVEHNGVTTNNVFNFRWTAPSTGTGTISFYAAGNAVNQSGGVQGDNAGNTTINLPEAQPLSVTGLTTPVSCNGGNNGAINITTSGGSAPYSYNWGNGITTEDRTGLSAGTYTVIITDNSGTSITNSYTITQPAVLVANVSNTPISCNGGTSTVSVSGSGGTFPYTGTGAFNENAGTHTYTITDANGCTSAPVSINITQPTAISVNATISNPIACHGGTATVNVTATGGTPPYTNTGTVSVTAGPETFTIIDANGCSALANIMVTEPPALTANVVLASPILCNGGTGTVTVSGNGGTPPYINTGTQVVSAGTGSFSITDSHGCSTSTTNITINEPSAITGTIVNINHNTGGNNGSIDVSVSGGTAPYTYSWSNGATTQDISQLAAGLYTLTITDANGCTQVMADLAVLFHVGIENEINNLVSIYPNPVSDNLYLNFESNITSPASIAIYNAEGKIVYETANLSEKLNRIDVSHFAVGTYFLVLKYVEKTYQYNWLKK